MHKIPRDLSGRELIKLLVKYGYTFDRECGSHIRLISFYKNKEHKITIPDHKQIKIGTLNAILKDIAEYLQIDKNNLLSELF